MVPEPAHPNDDSLPVSRLNAPVNVPNALLSRLVGYRPYSVQFVMDYVQLRFDGPTGDLPVLNCDMLPIVETPTGSVAAGQLGYADALCAFIAGSVVATAEEMGRGLRIEFAEGAICLHPEADQVPGPEIALLSGFTDGKWMCWRPGEDSFANLALRRSCQTVVFGKQP